MKKALSAVLLLTGLLLYGCSGGGTTSNGNNATSTPGGGSQPSFTVNLVDRAISLGTTTANQVRVVITRTELVPTPQTSCQYDANEDIVPGSCITTTVDLPTVVYKDIQDVPYSGSGSFVIGIPAGDTYTLDVITNRDQSIIKYGHGTADPSQGSATISMSTIGQLLDMKFPEPVISSQKFDVTLNNVLPFAATYNMTMSLASNPTISASRTTSSNKCTFTAPTTYTLSDSINLVGTFTLDRQFLKSNEKPSDWTRIFPSFDEQVTIAVTPLVNVTITPQ